MAIEKNSHLNLRGRDVDLIYLNELFTVKWNIPQVLV